MKKGIRKTAVQGFIWTATQNVGSHVSHLVVFIVLARLLSPTDFGVVAMANVCMSFLGLLTGAALTSALVQRTEIDSLHLDSMFWMIILLSSVIAITAWYLAPEIATFFNEPDVQPIIRWMVVCLPLGALQQIQISLLRRELKFRSLALRSLISVPIAGAIGIAFALSGFGAWSLVARIIAASGIQVVVLWYTVDWRPKFKFSFTHMRDLFGFGMNVTGANMLATVGQQLDVFLIGYVLGAGPLGFYTVAKRIVKLLVELVGGTIEKVAWPIFSRIQNDHRKVLESFYRATEYVSLMAFPAFAGIAILSDSIIPVVFGRQWVPSVPLMQALAIVGLIQSVLRFHETLMVGMGMPQLKLRLQLLLAIANLVAFLVAIRFGLVAVTVGYAVVAILLVPAWVMGVRAVVSLDVWRYTKNYTGAAIGSALMGVCILLANEIFRLEQASASILAIQVAIGVVSYSLIIATIRRNLVAEAIRSIRGGRHG